MVGSFYAFAIWIGLGAGAILWFLQSKIKSNGANIAQELYCWSSFYDGLPEL
jgi:hypothetical protein